MAPQGGSPSPARRDPDPAIRLPVHEFPARDLESRARVVRVQRAVGEVFEGVGREEVLVGNVRERLHAREVRHPNPHPSAGFGDAVDLFHRADDVVHVLDHVLAVHEVELFGGQRPRRAVQIVNDVGLGFRGKVEADRSGDLHVATAQIERLHAADGTGPQSRCRSGPSPVEDERTHRALGVCAVVSSHPRDGPAHRRPARLRVVRTQQTGAPP